MPLLTMAVVFTVKAAYKSVPANDPVVQVYFDSIPTGAVTAKELSSVKTLRVTSSLKTCKVKSFTLTFLHAKVPPLSQNLVGNQLASLHTLFAKAIPGDKILIRNLVIENMPKFKPDSELSWTVVKVKI